MRRLILILLLLQLSLHTMRGYIEKDLEQIVGLQTDAPLKRAIIPFGGIRMVESSGHAYNREPDPELKKSLLNIVQNTHNKVVFDVYTPDILKCRKSGILTGLPDAYGRGRIIGDYRRVALVRYRVPT